MSLSMEINCPVCYEPYGTPKALPCLHTFCQRCIDNCSHGGVIRCPECRKDHMVPNEGFPTNVALQRVLNSLRIRQSLVSEETPLLRAIVLLLGLWWLVCAADNCADYRVLQIKQQQICVLFCVLKCRREDPVHLPGRVDPSAPLLENDSDDDVSNGRLPNCRPPCTVEGIFGTARLIRRGEKYLLTEFLRRYKHYIFRTSVLFLMITLSRFIAGSVKLKSSCPMEHTVALYLFVKSWCAFVFWVVLFILSKTTEIDEMMENPWLEGYVMIDGFFSFIWFIIGTVWSSGSYDEMAAVCPRFIPGWDKAFVNFSVFLNVVDWIGVVVFVFYIGFIGCSNRDEMG